MQFLQDTELNTITQVPGIETIATNVGKKDTMQKCADKNLPTTEQ